ncbi:type IV secretory system conjugative DNA transfer family protein [Gordonia sp. 852002-51296_SCH5728562-b]|uniref:type IV secretory system conjugative DNA transfer family protein n=1 Tax=Gordonia sp. 852002-51296_SCH5728562-b TaxID=1834101 RepID=UPI0007E9B5EC|nr:TraM recognition domain-containing protein [Gordonia sp. 852002-51296_SCH5728562-b]OBA40778.1 hypothetical protein A5766_01940 [Gordonia sp. 852002-51296_SCH5728562-b]
MSLYRKGSVPFKPKPTPFGGFIDGEPAVTGSHLLVSGPSGVGKSRRVIIPAILMWQGPVVAISSKPDLIDMALQQRLAWGGSGRTYVLDLSGSVPDDVLPEGVTRVVADPVALVIDDDSAIDMSTILIQTGSAGAGDGSAKSDPFWDTISTAPLAALIRAAGPDGIAWARAAVGRVEAPVVEEGEEPDTTSPCWVNAIGRLEGMGSDMLAEELAGAAKLSDKMRDSVLATMKSAVAPWWRRDVVGPEGTTPFTPAMLEHPRSTLFMIAPADGVAAGAAVGVVDTISAHWRRAQTAPEPLPHLLIAVDELCNTLPWKKLPVVVTEARAMGIAVLAAVQATKQFSRRFGHDIMEELRAVFPSVLVLCEADEKEMLERAAWSHGRGERHKVSTDHAGRQSQSSELVETLHGSDLLPQDIDHGRLLRGRRQADADDPAVRAAGMLVELHDIDQLQFDAC